jgi:hypothetical protein
MTIEKRRVGRPRVRPPKDEPAGTYIGFKSPAALKQKLTAAAKSSDRSLSAETRARVEQTFDLPEGLWTLALALIADIGMGGRGAVYRRLLLLDSPSDEELSLRCAADVSRIQTIVRNELDRRAEAKAAAEAATEPPAEDDAA